MVVFIFYDCAFLKFRSQMAQSLNFKYVRLILYIILIPTVNPMKKHQKRPQKQKQHYQETDIQESVVTPPRNYQKYIIGKSKHRRPGKRETAICKAFHEKIYRFPLKHSRSTLRVLCYNESDLNLPLRFTKKLNKTEIDNDIESDSQLVQDEIARCSKLLQEAVANEVN